MRLILSLICALAFSFQAQAYSYSAAGKEPLIDGRNGIVGGLSKNDYEKVNKYFSLMHDDIEFLSSKYDKRLLEDFTKAVSEKNTETILNAIHRLYAAEIQRRLITASRNLDKYQTTKVMVIKSIRFFETISPELPKDISKSAEKHLNTCLEAIGKPGVFGAGQTPADPALFKEGLNNLVDTFAKL